MTAMYKIDPGRSRFEARAFATGMLSFLGHNPTFAVRDYAGTVSFAEGVIADMRVELTVRADSLAVTGDVSESDRREIESRMKTDVLETTAYPDITFRAGAASAERIATGQYRVRFDGQLSLHGVTHPHRVEAELTVFGDGIRLQGESKLAMSDYGIRPVTALGGTIRLKDEVRLTFDIGTAAEGS